MAATRATTIQQRQAIADLTSQGHSDQAVARHLGLSFWTVRKWARQAKRGGLAALVSVMGRPVTGPMAETDPQVRYVALRLKRQHPTWGAAYIRICHAGCRAQLFVIRRTCKKSIFYATDRSLADRWPSKLYIFSQGRLRWNRFSRRHRCVFDKRGNTITAKQQQDHTEETSKQ